MNSKLMWVTKNRTTEVTIKKSKVPNPTNFSNMRSQIYMSSHDENSNVNKSIDQSIASKKISVKTHKTMRINNSFSKESVITKSSKFPGSISQRTIQTNVLGFLQNKKKSLKITPKMLPTTETDMLTTEESSS